MNANERKGSGEPWKEREKLPSLRGRDVLLAALAVLIGALSLVLCTNENASFVTLLALTALGVLGMRRGMDLLLLLLGAFAVSMLTMSLGGAAAFLGLVIGAASLAFLFTTMGAPYAAILPLAIAVGAYLWTSDLFYALLAFSILPAGALLAIATLTHQRRTAAICFTVGGLLISLGAILALLFYRACGTLELSAITAYIDGLYGTLLETVSALRDEFFVYMRESLTAEGMTEAEISASLELLEATMSDAALSQILSMIFSILPALVVMIASVISFEAQLLLSHLYFYRGWRSVLTADATVFSVSVTAAVLYILTFLCTLFAGATTLVGAAVQNMCLILLPGLCVVGVGALRGLLRASRGGVRIFMILVLCAGFCCAGLSALYLLALWGAYSVIFSAIGKRIMEKLHSSSRDGGNGEDK